MPENAPENNSEDIQRKYKEKGIQKISLAEYEALKRKKSKKAKSKLPAHVKFILGTPLLIIGCLGVFFIPYVLFLIATGKSSDKPKGTDITMDQLVDPNEPLTKYPAK